MSPEPKPDPSSVATWVRLIRNGDPVAQQKIWDQFFPDLVALARKRLAGSCLREADEEDVALSVLNSFFGAASQNRFPDLRGEESLWRLLSWMTQRKAIDWLRHARRQRRRSLGESALGVDDEGALNRIAEVPDDIPTPDLAAMLTDELRRFMTAIPESMREVAILKLDGYSNQEISDKLACSVATIERRLKMIREIWRELRNEPTGSDSR